MPKSQTYTADAIPLQDTSIDIWDKKYRLKDKNGIPVDEAISDTFHRVAKALASVEEESVREYWYEQFDWALRNGALPAGRIISNAGANEYKPATSTINCTVSGRIEDSMDDILLKNHEAGLTLKAGCGIGYEFSTLRPQGAFVNGAGAYTSGPLSFMDIFDKMCFTVSSAGGRRGAQMATFDVHHPDVLEFIKAKREDGRLRQFNLSLLITEDFITAVKEDKDWNLSFPITKKEVAESPDELPVVYRHVYGLTSDSKDSNEFLIDDEERVQCRVYKTIKARRLWDTIMSSTYDFAEPGFILIDKVNQMNNNWFCEDIRATNPCVTPDTEILTRSGHVPISELVGQSVEVWNGYEWSEVTPRVTGENQKIIRVDTSDGGYLHCTPYHKFILSDGRRVEAKDLQKGDTLEKLQTFPSIQELNLDTVHEYLEDIEHFFQYYRHECRYEDNGTIVTFLEESLLDLGCRNARQLRQKLLFLGIPSKLIQDGLGCAIDSANFLKLASLAAFYGKPSLKEILKSRDVDGDVYSSLNSLTIVDIVDEGIIADKVYCFTEPKNNSGVFDGILTANCGEQPLPEYGSCLLGSVNLTKFVINPFNNSAGFDWERYRKVVAIFTRMLDNVVEINGLPLPQQRDEITRKRRHGMGFLGLGSTITMLGMKYGDEESIAFTDKVSRVMALVGWEQALELAKEKGPAPIMEEEFIITRRMLWDNEKLAECGYAPGDKIQGKLLHALFSPYMQLIGELSDDLITGLSVHGARFTHHTSIAPTGTISLSLANNVSNGIEPSFAHHYSRNVIREGKKTKEKVDVFSYELLAYRNMVNPNAMPYSEDPENALPDYFITADSVTPKQHVDIQAAAQKWVDSSISKTANIPTDFPFEDFKDIYMYAYDKGLKGCTTFRFNPEAFQGVLVKEKDLENTIYQFTLEDGSIVELRGNEEVEYDGETHTAANLYDALKEGYYGKF